MAHQLSCADAGMDCDFMIRSEDKDELVSFARQHVEDVHDQSMSKSDIEDLVTTA